MSDEVKIVLDDVGARVKKTVMGARDSIAMKAQAIVWRVGNGCPLPIEEADELGRQLRILRDAQVIIDGCDK